MGRVGRRDPASMGDQVVAGGSAGFAQADVIIIITTTSSPRSSPVMPIAKSSHFRVRFSFERIVSIGGGERSSSVLIGPLRYFRHGDAWMSPGLHPITRLEAARHIRSRHPRTPMKSLSDRSPPRGCVKGQIPVNVAAGTVRRMRWELGGPRKGDRFALVVRKAILRLSRWRTMAAE